MNKDKTQYISTTRQIILFDLKKELVNAWISILPKSKYPFVNCIVANFTDLQGTAIVSPANSFGFMNGGIDGAYSQYFGQKMVDDLQSKIQNDWDGELPIGCAEMVELENLKFSYLISAPTMRVPMQINNTANVYLATRAALLYFLKCPIQQGSKQIILIPGMGTGVGNVSAKLCANQMKRAIDDICLNKFIFPKTLSEAYQKHLILLQEQNLLIKEETKK